MNLRHLRYFVALAERLNFTETAKFLGIAQPPLSVQIRNLELEMGAALFHRERRIIRLTPLGVLLLEEARPLLQQADRAQERIRDAAEGRVGEIHIAYTEGAFSEKITRRIRKFLRKHRGVRFLATRQNYDNIFYFASAFDAIITETQGSVPNAVVLERVSAQIALTPKHRLSDHAEVTLADLIGESLILPPLNHCSPIEKAFAKAIAAQNIKLNHVEGPLSFSDRMWQVSIGLGVTICRNIDRTVLDAVRVPLVEPLGETLVQCLPTPASRAVTLASFLEAIRE